jgi:hypothetical protein
VCLNLHVILCEAIHVRELQEHHHIASCSTLLLTTAFAPKLLSLTCSERVRTSSDEFGVVFGVMSGIVFAVLLLGFRRYSGELCSLTTAFAPKLLSLTCSYKALAEARPQLCMCQAASMGTIHAHHATMH